MLEMRMNILPLTHNCVINRSGKNTFRCRSLLINCISKGLVIRICSSKCILGRASSASDELFNNFYYPHHGRRIDEEVVTKEANVDANDPGKSLASMAHNVLNGVVFRSSAAEGDNIHIGNDDSIAR